MIEGREGASGSVSRLLGLLGEIGNDLADRVWLASLRGFIWLLTIGSRADDKQAEL